MAGKLCKMESNRPLVAIAIAIISGVALVIAAAVKETIIIKEDSTSATSIAQTQISLNETGTHVAKILIELTTLAPDSSLLPNNTPSFIVPAPETVEPTSVIQPAATRTSTETAIIAPSIEPTSTFTSTSTSTITPTQGPTRTPTVQLVQQIISQRDEEIIQEFNLSTDEVVVGNANTLAVNGVTYETERCIVYTVRGPGTYTVELKYGSIKHYRNVFTEENANSLHVEEQANIIIYSEPNTCGHRFPIIDVRLP
jgi:hypothetical protein